MELKTAKELRDIVLLYHMFLSVSKFPNVFRYKNRVFITYFYRTYIVTFFAVASFENFEAYSKFGVLNVKIDKHK